MQAGLNFTKKRLQHRCFPVNIVIFLRTPILKNICKRLLLSEDEFEVKVGLSSSEKILVICFIESPLKMIKNAFYFILKAFFVLKIFKFLSWLFGHAEKKAWLEDKVIFQNSWRYNLVNKQLNLYELSQLIQATFAINKLRYLKSPMLLALKFRRPSNCNYLQDICG